MKTTHDSPQTSIAQAPDTQPGNYYVSAVDADRHFLMLGPFPNDHAAALAAVEEVRSTVTRLDTSGRAHFMGFGTLRMRGDVICPGNLNKHLAHLLPVTNTWSLESPEQALSRIDRQPATV